MMNSKNITKSPNTGIQGNTKDASEVSVNAG